MNVTILSLSLNHLFQNSIKGFVNAGWSLLRTLVGTTGDTGFSDVFLGSPLPYLPVAAIMFIIFLILMPVLFNNMLVSTVRVCGIWRSGNIACYNDEVNKGLYQFCSQ